MPQLKVYIHKDGTVKIDVIGVEGEKCLDITKFLEDALGVVTERQTKESFYASPKETVDETERNDYF